MLGNSVGVFLSLFGVYYDVTQKIKTSGCPISVLAATYLHLYHCFHCAAPQPPVSANFPNMGPNLTLESGSGFALP